LALLAVVRVGEALSVPGSIAAVALTPFTVTGVTNALLYARFNASRLSVSRERAFGAYMVAVLSANAIFAVFALTYYGVFAGV
jgi:hypothetical protein